MVKIAVIDDEKDVVELVRFILEKEGHTIIESNDGISGLALIQKEIPDLVILDVMMPGIDGYTLNERLLGNDATRKIPVLVLTSKAKVRELFQIAPNVAAYMDKPFDPIVLKSKVREILDKKPT
jgi:two-component system, OmpR family, alkaline phosphatase synthesis response regulator PhoP